VDHFIVTRTLNRHFVHKICPNIP